MRHSAAALSLYLLLVLVVAPVPAGAQTPGPPGPYVVDARGGTISLPSTVAFATAPPADAFVPRRGWGVDVGGHVYPMSLGPSRIGVGLDVLRARGTSSLAATSTGSGSSTASTESAGSVHVNVTAIVPQVSFNFGNRTGWSFLSAGYGWSRLAGSLVGVPGKDGATDGGTAAPADAPAAAEWAGTINFGGGARWFSKARLGVGFDIRFLMMSASGEIPKATMVSAFVGVSVR